MVSALKGLIEGHKNYLTLFGINQVRSCPKVDSAILEKILDVFYFLWLMSNFPCYEIITYRTYSSSIIFKLVYETIT